MSSSPSEWFADEWMWKDLFPFHFPPSAFAIADEQIEKVVRLTGVERGTALDLCCGPGRHTVALAKRGFTVTAVDRSPFLLESARTRAAEANVAVEFVREDMRRFSRPAAFDLIVNTSRRSAISTTRRTISECSSSCVRTCGPAERSCSR